MEDGIDGCMSKASPFPDRVPMPRLSPTRPVTGEEETEPDVVAVSDDTEANDDEERRSRSSGSLSSSGGASSTAGNPWRRVPTGSRRRDYNEYHNMKSLALATLLFFSTSLKCSA